MKFILTMLFLLFSNAAFCQNRVNIEDLKLIEGNWVGEITYLDYRTNKPFTMPANLIVEKGKNERQLVLNNIYPNEPKANNTEKLKISKDGTRFNKDKVTSRITLDDGAICIEASREGKDDNKNAQIRYTYILSNASILIRKEVQFDAAEDWIKRSEFNYKRKK